MAAQLDGKKPRFSPRDNPVHKKMPCVDARIEVESLCELLTKATQTGVKNREHRNNSQSCDIRGQIHFTISDKESGGDELLSHFCMIRKSEIFGDHYFKNRDYTGLKFYYPITSTESLVEIETILVLCDNKERVLDSKVLGADVLAQIIRKVVMKLGEYAFEGFIECDITGEQAIEALKETARSIILAHRGNLPRGGTMAKLASKYGYTGLLYSCIFAEVYSDLSSSGALKKSSQS